MGDKKLTFDDHIEVLTNGFRDWNGDIRNLPQVREVTAALRDAWEVRERAEAALEVRPPRGATSQGWACRTDLLRRILGREE